VVFPRRLVTAELLNCRCPEISQRHHTTPATAQSAYLHVPQPAERLGGSLDARRGSPVHRHAACTAPSQPHSCTPKQWSCSRPGQRTSAPGIVSRLPERSERILVAPAAITPAAATSPASARIQRGDPADV
jgi:hypothetical protein